MVGHCEHGGYILTSRTHRVKKSQRIGRQLVLWSLLCPLFQSSLQQQDYVSEMRTRVHAHLGLCLCWPVFPHHIQCTWLVPHAPNQKGQAFSQAHILAHQSPLLPVVNYRVSSQPRGRGEVVVALQSSGETELKVGFCETFDVHLLWIPSEI